MKMAPSMGRAADQRALSRANSCSLSRRAGRALREEALRLLVDKPAQPQAAEPPRPGGPRAALVSQQRRGRLMIPVEQHAH